MIQLHSNALIVCYPDGRMEPLDVDHLMQRLAEDGTTDVLDPWILQKVIESVVQHVRNDLKRDHIQLAELIEWMRSLLEGYVQEAIHSPKPMGSTLDLFETARRCGTGFELEFFSEVRRFLMTQSVLLPQESLPVSGDEETGFPEKTSEGGGKFLQFTGLRRCAKYLSGRRRWSKRSSEMRDEILTFIRQEVVRTGLRNLALVKP